MKKVIIGSRGSELALWQANFTKEQLEEQGVQVEIKIIKTKGDKIQHLSFDKIEGKGFFTKELEDALLTEEIDLAVHSYKDMPTDWPEGLILAGNSYREDPADIMLIRKNNVNHKKQFHLKSAAVVGTSSARRKAQLLLFRPDLQMKDIRGNVPTRIDKLRQGQFDAILLAKAGVQRIAADISEFEVITFKPHQFIPAPAQGVLAFQIRENDQQMKELINNISDEVVKDTNEVERKVLKLFGGGCHIPAGAYCIKNGDEYLVWGSRAEAWDAMPTRVFIRSAIKDGLAERVVERIDHQEKKKIFITRELENAKYFTEYLTQQGHEVSGHSLIDFEKVEMKTLPSADWIFFSSKNGVKYLSEQPFKISENIKIAAIGEGTAAALNEHNIPVNFVGSAATTEEVAEQFLKLAAGQKILFPRAENSNRTVQQQIKDRAEVIDLVVYKNTPAEDISIPDVDIVVFTSPMNVEAYFKHEKLSDKQTAIAIGIATGKALDEAGVEYILAYRPEEICLADAVMGV